MKKAVVLFSGGLDSTTVLAYARAQGFDCYPISFDYGQRHSIELMAAKKIADFFAITQHKIIQLPNHMFGASALTDASIAVPDYAAQTTEIPLTYVPARNTIFLSIALGYAESIGHTTFSSASAVSTIRAIPIADQNISKHLNT